MKQTIFSLLLFFTTYSWAQIRGGGGEKDFNDQNMETIKVDVKNIGKISKDLFNQCYKQKVQIKGLTDLYVHMASIQNLHHLEHGKSWDICDKESKKVNWSCLKGNDHFKFSIKKIVDSPAYYDYLRKHEHGIDSLQAKEIKEYFYKALDLKKHENRR